MLIIREVLTAKPGQASKLAKLFKKVFGSDPNPENIFVRLTACVNGLRYPLVDETTPHCRNQLQATQTAQKRADSHQSGNAVLGCFDLEERCLFGFILFIRLNLVSCFTVWTKQIKLKLL